VFNNYVLLLRYLGVLFVGALASCTSTPKGTPTSTRVSSAAADVLAVASGSDLRHNLGDTVAETTRIEIMVTGLMSCVTLLHSDIGFEILDAASSSLTAGSFSQKWNSVTTARIKGKTAYTVQLRSQRSGKVVFEETLVFSGEAPWKIFVPVECPNGR
jgi:hypothetical protein